MTKTEKEIMIEKMKFEKSLIELQDLFARCPKEWKDEEFYLFAMKLEAKLERAAINKEIK